MLNEINIPLSKDSLCFCKLRKIPGCCQSYVADPEVIKKVESSKNYFLSYEDRGCKKSLNRTIFTWLILKGFPLLLLAHP